MTSATSIEPGNGRPPVNTDSTSCQRRRLPRNVPLRLVHSTSQSVNPGWAASNARSSSIRIYIVSDWHNDFYNDKIQPSSTLDQALDERPETNGIPFDAGERGCPA